MKVYAYIHPDLKTLCCALIPEAIPEGVKAVELEVETPDDVILDNDKIRLKTEEEKLQEAKQKAINDLSQKTSAYILKYYPDIKQMSDDADKENGESYLVYRSIDPIAFRKDLTTLILSNADFQTTLSKLNQKYNPNNDEMIAYWISQLIKVGYRKQFVFLVKQELATYLQQIQQTTFLPLPNFEFKTPFPALP